MSSVTDDDDILAAEYALGLLDAEEARAVETRLAADAALSLRVAWWRDELSGLADEGHEAPPQLWSRIAKRLAANDNALDRSILRRWQAATATLGAIAAALIAVIVFRPTPVAPPAPSPVILVPMVASLAGARGAAVAVSYDTQAARIVVTPVSLDAGVGDAELWVIPVGETLPVSLGVINAARPEPHAIDARRAILLREGATFAISREAKGGSVSGQPAGPIVASGKLVSI